MIKQFGKNTKKDRHKSVKKRKVKMKENDMMLSIIVSGLCLTTQNGELLFNCMPCPHFCSTLKAKLHNVSTPPILNSCSLTCCIFYPSSKYCTKYCINRNDFKRFSVFHNQNQIFLISYANKTAKETKRNYNMKFVCISILLV